MAKSVWEKAGDEARQVAEQADTKADSLLDKLKASKWTAAILIGSAVAGAVLLIKSLFF